MSPRKSGPCNHNSYFKSLVIIRLTTLRPSSLSVIYCSVAFRRQRRIIKEKKHMTPIEALISQTRNIPSEEYHVTRLAYAEVMVISSYLPKDTLTFVILGNQNFYFLCFKLAHELGVCSLTCSLLCRPGMSAAMRLRWSGEHGGKLCGLQDSRCTASWKTE